MYKWIIYKRYSSVFDIQILNSSNMLFFKSYLLKKTIKNIILVFWRHNILSFCLLCFYFQVSIDLFWHQPKHSRIKNKIYFSYCENEAWTNIYSRLRLYPRHFCIFPFLYNVTLYIFFNSSPNLSLASVKHIIPTAACLL